LLELSIFLTECLLWAILPGVIPIFTWRP